MLLATHICASFRSLQALALQSSFNPQGSDLFAAITFQQRRAASSATGAGDTPKLAARLLEEFGDLKSPLDAPAPRKKKQKTQQGKKRKGADRSDSASSSNSDSDRDSEQEEGEASPLAFQRGVVRKLKLPPKAYAIKSSSAVHRQHKPTSHSSALLQAHSDRYLATLGSRKTKAQDDHYSGSISPTTGKVELARRVATKGKYNPADDEEQEEEESDGREGEERFSDEDGDFN